MAVFANCSVLLELRNVSLKERKSLTSAITDGGGAICFVVNEKCSLVVTDDVRRLSRRRLEGVARFRTPVVRVEYVSTCVERGALLPVEEFKLETPPLLPPPTRLNTSRLQETLEDSVVDSTEKTESEGRNEFRTDETSRPPAFPDHFQVAKFSVLEQVEEKSWCVLELQSCRVEGGRLYRLVRSWKDHGRAQQVRRETRVLSTSEQVLSEYQTLRDSLRAGGFEERTSLPEQDQDLGSAVLQQVCLFHCSTTNPEGHVCRPMPGPEPEQSAHPHQNHTGHHGNQKSH